MLRNTDKLLQQATAFQKRFLRDRKFDLIGEVKPDFNNLTVGQANRLIAKFRRKNHKEFRETAKKIS